MEDISFASIEELYKRVRPALMTKREELKRSGITYVTEEDIWNYLKDNVWNNSRNLRLFRMVSDILNSDNALIDDYIKSKMGPKTRTVYFNDKMEDDVNEKENA